ncbi:MAG: hypothetical protein ACK56I_17875, partial [bacterium]
MEAVWAEASRAERDARQTVVLCNSRAPGSVELARFYAAQRRIPQEQIVAVDCAPEEEVSRTEFDREIAGPLRATFLERGWWDPEKRGEPERG